MRNRRKAVGDVRLDHPPAAPRALIDEHLQGIVRRPLRAEPEAAVQEVRLEDRLEHDLHRGLHDPVPNREESTAAAARPSTRLGDQHPPRGQRPIAALPQFAASSSSSRAIPYSSTSAKVILSMPGAPLLPAHRDPRAPQDVPAIDLVHERVESPSGIGLGRPVERMLQGTDRIPGTRGSHGGGTSRDGTHRAPPPQRCASTKQRPFPHRRLCCPLGSTSTTAASDAHPASDPLPGFTGYRTPRSGNTIRRSPGRGGPPQFPPPPSIRSAPHTPGSPSRLRFQALHRFHGLHPDFEGLGTPLSRPERAGL